MTLTNVTLAALLVSLLNGTASAAVVLFGLRRRGARAGAGAARLGLDAVVRLELVACVLFVVGVVAAVGLWPVDTFGVIHFAYLEGVVGAPLGAALVLAGAFATRGGPQPIVPTRSAAAVLTAVLLLAPLGFYMTHIEPYRLETDRVGPITIAAERSGSAPVRIGVLTDWQLQHVGDYERSAIDRLLAEHPDIVLLPGDVFQDDEAAFQRELPALREQLARLDVPGGAFLVQGDSDPVAHLQAMVEGTPVRFLHDEIVQTHVGDRAVTIGGSRLEYDAPSAVQTAHDLEARPGTDDIRILLTHRPDAVRNLPPHGRTDLTVAGHTHGGQVALPLIGPIMTLTEVPRAVAAGGSHDLDGRRIYVGRGVGLERNQAPQIRLLVPPNIGLLDLRD